MAILNQPWQFTPTDIDPTALGGDIAAYYRAAMAGNPAVSAALGKMAGNISPSTIRNIRQRAAERGISVGLNDSPALDTMYLNAIGKTAEDVSAQGAQEYASIFGAIPKLDPSSLFIDPEAQQNAALEWAALGEKIKSGEKLNAAELANAREIAAMNNQAIREGNQLRYRAASEQTSSMMGILNQLLNKPTRASDFSNPWGGSTAGGGLWNSGGGAAFSSRQGPSGQGDFYAGTNDWLSSLTDKQLNSATGAGGGIVGSPSVFVDYDAPSSTAPTYDNPPDPWAAPDLFDFGQTQMYA